jgi:hypothetical protein
METTDSETPNLETSPKKTPTTSHLTPKKPPILYWGFDI